MFQEEKFLIRMLSIFPFYCGVAYITMWLFPFSHKIPFSFVCDGIIWIALAILIVLLTFIVGGKE